MFQGSNGFLLRGLQVRILLGSPLLVPKIKPLRLPTNRSEQHGNSTALRAPDHHWALSAANRKSPSARWAKLACDALSSFVPITGAATPLPPSPMAGQMMFKIV